MARRQHRWQHVAPSHQWSPVTEWHRLCECGWHERFRAGPRGGTVAVYQRGDANMTTMPKCEAQEGER